jgi:hypothetical protein
MRIFYNSWSPVKAISSSLTNQMVDGQNEISSSLSNQFQKSDFSSFLNLEPLVRDLRNIKNKLQPLVGDLAIGHSKPSKSTLTIINYQIF